ncbi:hypothetical protein H4Q26_007282 [Puccinia striiformis f. sp. tritici PST-130]|nr:hypothetical protein H4Q26_007282 [Puccinia striiformis f. sp. tritici PST-130]
MSTNAETLNANERYELITRNLGEVLGSQELLKLCQEEGRIITCYWGTATTGRPHIGYFVPLTKIADFLRAGVRVKVLLADVHAFLDNLKAPLELINQRVSYYSHILRAVFTSIGVPIDRLEFITGSSYQYSTPYNKDCLKLASLVSERDARKAGSEVVKESDAPPLSGLLYPLLQALDEEYLGVDFQFGGIDQRKIFTFAELYLPRLGYAKRIHLMNTMVPGLTGTKMSSSDAKSKIDFLDTPKMLRRRSRMRSEKPIRFQRRTEGTLFSVVRKREKDVLHYTSYTDIVRDYQTEEPVGSGSFKLFPSDLKLSVTNAILTLLAPIRETYENDPQFKEANRLAYPDDFQNSSGDGKKKKDKKFTPKPDWVIEKERQNQSISMKEVGEAIADTRDSTKAPSTS